MKNVPLLIGTLVSTLVLVIGIAFFFGKSSEPKTIDALRLKSDAKHVLTASENEPNTATPSAAVASESAESSSSAKKVVTIVEFSDLQCPACKAAAPIREQVRSAYPGQVEFVFRHYPLTQIHPNALLAAQAAEAAATFDQFWQYHDLLYSTQEEWSELSSDQAREKFVQYAESLKIDKNAFTQQLNSDTVKSAVQSDINLGNDINISATPTFFVDGKQVSASDVEKTVADILAN